MRNENVVAELTGKQEALVSGIPRAIVQIATFTKVLKLTF